MFTGLIGRTGKHRWKQPVVPALPEPYRALNRRGPDIRTAHSSDCRPDQVTVPRPELRLVNWLPDKDRAVLAAAIRLRCDILLTGDRTHFGAGYDKVYAGVAIHSPRPLAEQLFK